MTATDDLGLLERGERSTIGTRRTDPCTEQQALPLVGGIGGEHLGESRYERVVVREAIGDRGELLLGERACASTMLLGPVATYETTSPQSLSLRRSATSRWYAAVESTPTNSQPSLVS